MRILIITQGISPIVLPLFRSHHEIIGIAEDSLRTPPSYIQKTIGNFISTIRNVINKKNQNLLYFCKNNGISYFFINDVQKFENWVVLKKPDLIVVYSMSHLLKKEIFLIPDYGTINLHPALLPKYRGPNPYIWMYYNMDIFGGVTVHYIDEGEDTGDIIFQEKFPITFGISLKQLQFHMINEIGSKLLINAIDAIEDGTAPRRPQLNDVVSIRARNLLQKEEITLINWELLDVKRIWHLVNGYYGIYDFIGYIDIPPFGYKLIIETFIECLTQRGDVGKIGINNDGSRYITCIDGKIIYRYKFDIFYWFQKNYLIYFK